MPIVILQYLYSLQIKGDSHKKKTKGATVVIYGERLELSVEANIGFFATV
jgi:hypothetical protein